MSDMEDSCESDVEGACRRCMVATRFSPSILSDTNDNLCRCFYPTHLVGETSWEAIELSSEIDANYGCSRHAAHEVWCSSTDANLWVFAARTAFSPDERSVLSVICRRDAHESEHVGKG